MADLLFAPLERLGFGDIVLWLLSFALIYGILSQLNLPKAKSAQAIIALVFAFFVLMAAPSGLITTISNLSIGLLVALLGILFLLIMIEVGNVRHLGPTGEREVDIGGGKKVKVPVFGETKLFTKHPKQMAAIIITLVVLMFVGAGGLGNIGITLPAGIDPLGALFMAVVAVAVIWMLTQKEDEKEGQ